ncbi:MAG TPA: signal peptidase I [Candidatus Saccharimonadales bacterium]|nr:signal peptidase I [Candidatus Saccharimonadales bacterium]
MTQEDPNPHEGQTPQSQPAKTNHYVPPRRAERRGINRRKEGWGSVVSTIAVLLIAPLIALVLTAFVFQSYQVDGPSMETTLQNNDRLLVWKVPKTWSRLTGNAYIPNRGDVVVFVEEEASGFNQNPGKQLIKRVIALPGERIVIKNSKVTVFNDEYPDGFQPDKTLPFGRVITSTSGDTDTVVAKDHVYVLGDNRSNSLDSRAFGEIASEDIVGKLIMRVWPAGNMKAF